MVNSIGGSQTSSILTDPTSKPATSSGSTSSFTDQLVAALQGFLSQSGNSSDLEIDIKSTQSQDSGARQFLVTVKDPSSTSASTSSSTSGGMLFGGSGIAPGVVAPQATAPATSSATPATPAAAPAAGSPVTVTASSHAVSDAPAPAYDPMAEQDAYWAAQPKAVQQLRNLDMGSRAIMAQQLADEGYAIDRPIMVWGWDPKMTMQARKEYGYTWVPSWNQASVSSPGLAISNQIPYDPNKPPPGSIAVNTDFANGLDA